VSEKEKRGDSLSTATSGSGTPRYVITYIVLAAFGGFLLGAIVFMALLQEGGLLNPPPTPTATDSDRHDDLYACCDRIADEYSHSHGNTDRHVNRHVY